VSGLAATDLRRQAIRVDEHQAEYDEAMFEFSTGNFDGAIEKLNGILAQEPDHFDAQLSIAMCHYRKGDYARAIQEGHRAEKLKPNEQLVHTNLSLFYMKSGDKKTAEHHGLQARIASWKQDLTKPGAAPPSPAPDAAADELKMAGPKPQAFKLPEKFPDMPWKKNKPAAPTPGETKA
jgi:tetratricopeptide (TPR) repeat protein